MSGFRLPFVTLLIGQMLTIKILISCHNFGGPLILGRQLLMQNTNVETANGFKCVAMHRMIMGDAQEDWQSTMTGYLQHELDNGKTVFILPKGTRLRKRSVDHMDGNGLNNTRANLRHLSLREQIRNRRL